jgi:chromosome segregation ATPase
LWRSIQAYLVAYRNTLVCDTMAEGKQLSWGQGPERHKVATLDGTLFAKAGSITGGMAGNLAGRAQRWGDKEYETLKKVRCLV